MTPEQIAHELYELYTISYGNKKWEAKSYALNVLHITALANNMSYKEYYEITKEIEKI